PDDETDLLRAFEQALHERARYGPVVVLIDALDELEEEHARSLGWLPRHLPDGVRFILSTRDESAARALDLLPVERVELLRRLDDRETAAIIDEVFRDSEPLEPGTRARLIEQAVGNPLYLKVALEELTTVGPGQAQLTGRVEDLFEARVCRCETAYGAE